MSYDTTRPGRHRPILHLRQTTGSTDRYRTDSTRLWPADPATKQGTSRDLPDAARGKRQGGRRFE